jgi:octaheme c-type cytochrome (tetrathionate reductase family)
MKNSNYTWLIGLIVTVAIILIPIILFGPRAEAKRDNPQAHLPPDPKHTDHTELMKGPYETASDVTRACLACHPEAGEQVLHTAHWTWESEPVYVPERDQTVTTGKKNSINNFCIGIQGNWPGCTSCHAGYGWSDETFDFSNQENIDCLVCHESAGGYTKSTSGYPAEEVDLAAIAQSVTNPTRENCGGCHFKGGGGNAVKHGDLDESLYFPTSRIDVHMGEYGFQCVTCHQTKDHNIKGRAISVSMDDANQLYCTDCHHPEPHQDERLNGHTDTVACQSCHIPTVAKKEATKIHWDWSTAGEEGREENPHSYLKIKGSFAYQKELQPEYYWYNGTAGRYLLGDKIDPAQPTPVNLPHGDITDPTAKIWPFKVHRANQIYDTEYNYFIQPKTYGEGGYWEDFDWDEAARLGSAATGLPYSGSYDFAPSEMYWPLSHMVSPRQDALQCVDCHQENGRMDWKALGYEGDPVEVGGRTIDAVPLTLEGDK